MKPTIGMQITMSIGTDAYPYEIIEVVNDRKFIARKMDAKNKAQFPEQDWEFTSNENNRTVEVTRKKRGWGQKGNSHVQFFLESAYQYLDPSL